MAPFSDEDVCGFEVAVNDALRMRDIEGLCDIGGDGEDLIQSKRPRVDKVFESGAVEEFYHEESFATEFAHVMNRADVRG